MVEFFDRAVLCDEASLAWEFLCGERLGPRAVLALVWNPGASLLVQEAVAIGYPEVGVGDRAACRFDAGQKRERIGLAQYVAMPCVRRERERECSGRDHDDCEGAPEDRAPVPRVERAERGQREQHAHRRDEVVRLAAARHDEKGRVAEDGQGHEEPGRVSPRMHGGHDGEPDAAEQPEDANDAAMHADRVREHFAEE